MEGIVIRIESNDREIEMRSAFIRSVSKTFAKIVRVGRGRGSLQFTTNDKATIVAVPLWGGIR
jgi:hypothetical protein